MAILRVRDHRYPGDKSHDVDLGPYPEVRRRWFPRRDDIDTQLGAARKPK